MHLRRRVGGGRTPGGRADRRGGREPRGERQRRRRGRGEGGRAAGRRVHARTTQLCARRADLKIAIRSCRRGYTVYSIFSLKHAGLTAAGAEDAEGAQRLAYLSTLCAISANSAPAAVNSTRLTLRVESALKGTKAQKRRLILFLKSLLQPSPAFRPSSRAVLPFAP